MESWVIFAGLLIIFFGWSTLHLHDEMMSGDRAALVLIGLIGGFWAFRLAVDFLYFSHEDLPEGPLFVIGHTMLTSLFVFLAGTYLTLLAWHLS